MGEMGDQEARRTELEQEEARPPVKEYKSPEQAGAPGMRCYHVLGSTTKTNTYQPQHASQIGIAITVTDHRRAHHRLCS